MSSSDASFDRPIARRKQIDSAVFFAYSIVGPQPSTSLSGLMNVHSFAAFGVVTNSERRSRVPTNPLSSMFGASRYTSKQSGLSVDLSPACDYDPRLLTTITKDEVPIRTLARRVDGALPSSVNPVAIWEIKEYYYTTTFGSRVADGVYETLLDGMELEELHEHENIDVQHCLMIDAHYTWWECGKSYLCRIIDMLNMGYVDDVLFGYEVVEELPRLTQEWVRRASAT